MIGAATGADWHPSTAEAQCVPHTWVTEWDRAGVKAIVDEAREQAWQCVLIESTSHPPIARTTRAAIIAAGATVVGPDTGAIHTCLTMVDNLLALRMLAPRPNPQTSEQRPMLLLVGDGDHIRSDVLLRVALLGRAGDILLAVDDRARKRTPWQLDANVLGVYRGTAER